MYVKALMVLEPAFHLGVFMRRVVVTNDMNLFIGWSVLVEESQKTQPFGVTMALGTLTQHFSGQYVKRRKQRRGAVAFVVMGHGGIAASLDG